MSKYEKILLGIIVVASCLWIYLSFFANAKSIEIANERQDNLATMLNPNGQPMLVSQNKVGDDKLPHIHQTWCQILPYKRTIADDQVFCYVEVITEWSVGHE